MPTRCNCTEWKPNIEKVNAPLSYLYARNPYTYKGYTGVQFKYCPWCSKALEEYVDETVVEDTALIAPAAQTNVTYTPTQDGEFTFMRENIDYHRPSPGLGGEQVPGN